MKFFELFCSTLILFLINKKNRVLFFPSCFFKLQIIVLQCHNKVNIHGKLSVVNLLLRLSNIILVVNFSKTIWTFKLEISLLHLRTIKHVIFLLRMTSLHYACMGNGYLNCVSILLEAKAQPNIVDVEVYFWYFI